MHVYLINASTGSHIWNYTTQNQVSSSPALSPKGDILYVGSKDNNLYAFPARRIELWRYTTGGGVDTSPVLSPSGDTVRTVYIYSLIWLTYLVPLT